MEIINKSVENLSMRNKTRVNTPSTGKRPVSRGGVSRATSYSNYSRLSVNSERQLKRKDSFDEIAKNLAAIERKLDFKRTRQLENLQRRAKTAYEQNKRAFDVSSRQKDFDGQRKDQNFEKVVLKTNKIKLQ
jgi:hypothetical protein